VSHSSVAQKGLRTKCGASPQKPTDVQTVKKRKRRIGIGYEALETGHGANANADREEALQRLCRILLVELSLDLGFRARPCSHFQPPAHALRNDALRAQN